MATPVIVELPLRGEWEVVLSPAYLGREHEPNLFTRALARLTGHAYAYDFVRPGSGQGRWRNLTGRRSATADPSWGQTVYAPFDGEVVAVGENWPDKEWISWIQEFGSMFAQRRQITPDDLRPAAGNYLLIRSWGGAVAFLAHLRSGAVSVAQGQRVSAGQPIGQVGHSGTSYVPHLHLQVMDHPDLFRAGGVPFCFRQYERWDGEGWSAVVNSHPKRWERIRR